MDQSRFPIYHSCTISLLTMIIVTPSSCIHSTSEKVYGFCFSVQNILRKKSVREAPETIFFPKLGIWLVDRPTQLVCIWIFICWVGGGNPCGVADFCIGDSCRNKKHTGFIFFFKISFLCIFCPWHSKKQGKKLIQTLKKPVFTVLPDSVLVQI